MKRHSFFVVVVLTLPFVTSCNKNLSGGYSQTKSNTSSSTLPAAVATLDLDFASDRYVLNHTNYTGLNSFITAAGATFSRSSTATYYDATGTVQTAAVNSPRLDHDPATGTAKGLLIEEASTNNLLYSSDFSQAAWLITTPITRTVNAGLAPDGTMTAALFNADGSGKSYIQQFAGTVASITVTRSFFIKPGTASLAVMEFGDTTNCGAYCTAYFDLKAQTANWGSVKTGEGAVVLQKLNNGWFRISATYSHSAVGSNHDVLYIGAYGNGVGSVYLWGPQLEFKSFSTSYVSTGAAIASRSADVFSFPVASWFNVNAGTFLSTTFGQNNSNQTNFGRVVGGDNNLCYNGFSSTLKGMNSSTNMSSLPVLGTVTASSTTSVNMAMSWDQASMTESVGMTSGQLAAGTFAGDWSTTNLYPGGSNLNALNASVSRVLYYSTRLADSDLVGWVK